METVTLYRFGKAEGTLPVLKEKDLVFRNAWQMKTFLDVDKEKFKYIAFIYSKSQYCDFTQFANELKEYDYFLSDPYFFEVNGIVELDKTLDKAHYLNCAIESMRRIKIENATAGSMIFEERHVYKQNYESLKHFVVQEKIKTIQNKVTQTAKSTLCKELGDSGITVADVEVELMVK